MEKAQQFKILTVDDNEIIRMQIETILQQNDYTSIFAENGKIGLEKAIKEQPQAIILDRNMPEMDGNMTLMHLKDNEETKDIPVIMLTGDDRATDISTSLELGALDYIVKPFDHRDFLLRLANILKQKCTA